MFISYPFPSINFCRHVIFNKHQTIFRPRKCLYFSLVLFHSYGEEVNLYWKILRCKTWGKKSLKASHGKQIEKCFLLCRSCAKNSCTSYLPPKQIMQNQGVRKKFLPQEIVPPTPLSTRRVLSYMRWLFWFIVFLIKVRILKFSETPLRKQESESLDAGVASWHTWLCIPCVLYDIIDLTQTNNNALFFVITSLIGLTILKDTLK